MTELKPCPFCGNEKVQAEVEEDDRRYYSKVRCLNWECEADLNAQGRFAEPHHAYEAAAKAWNKRA